ANVRSLDKHSLLYGDERMRARVAFLRGDVPAPVLQFKARIHASVVPHASASAELDRLRGSLERLGLDAIVVDVTPDDVAALGFVVVRVVVPDLHPLWGGHHVRCLGGTRVRTVPARLGYPN